MYTLYASLRSPFARRIRLLLDELKVQHEVVILDVFNPPASFFEVNPLGRVPALKIENGEVLVESHQIQNFLQSRYTTHPLFQTQGFSLARCLNFTAIATGMMDFTVQAFLETLRPDGMRSLESLEDARGAVKKALGFFTQNLKGPYLLGDALSVRDFDLGSALRYCDLRLGRQVVDGFPLLRAYSDRLEMRSSFQKTVPPA